MPVRQLIVAGAQRRLDLGRTAHRFDGAAEFGQDRISRGVEDATAVQDDELLEDFLMPAEGPQRLFPVLRHQAAVPGDIRREDRGELSFKAPGAEPSVSANCGSFYFRPKRIRATHIMAEHLSKPLTAGRNLARKFERSHTYTEKILPTFQ
jgi:hypothetical protein